MSEQEDLAKLVRQDDLEPIDTASLIEDELRNLLGGVSSSALARVKDEIEAHGDVVASSNVKRMGESSSKLPPGYSTEKMLVNLYDIRDDLISTFEIAGLNSKTSERLASSISKVEGCIKTAGGDIDRFIPLNHLSGLTAPSFIKNAQKVIETTLQCYTLGKIEEAKIKDGGKSIHIVFSGDNGKMQYVANGTVTAEEWTGNEAIDYVYTPGEGNMTVKAFENGRWTVKSLSGSQKYKVMWDLEEKEIIAKKINKENVKGSENITQNNDEEDIGAEIDNE